MNTNDKLDYPGKELEIFDKATFWRSYLFKKIEKFLGKEVLEVGAGIGSFTKTYYSKNKIIKLTELDSNLLKILKSRFKDCDNISIDEKFTKNINQKFDSILYISVLEHIKNDTEEIEVAISKLKKNGHLIVCVPAHNYMYSKFDKEIGHYRRYNKKFFEELNLSSGKLKECYMLDITGWFMYFLNKLVFKNEEYPSKFKVMIWDKLFIPISIIFDFITNYKFGKNIIIVIQKI